MGNQIKILAFSLSFMLKTGSVLATNNNPLNARDEAGRTALIRAAEAGTEEEARGLIENGASLDIQD